MYIFGINLETKFQSIKLSQRFWEFAQTGILTDIILVVSDENQTREFPVHKIILMAGSKFFETMLTSGYQEAQASKINIKSNPISFEYVLKFIYGFIGDYDIQLDDEVSFQIISDLIYFDVAGFRANDYLEKIYIPDHFDQYIKLLMLVHPEGIPPEEINRIAQYIDTETDLSPYADEFIIAVLSNPNYHLKKIGDAYNLIHDLVQKGATPELYALINYDLIPESMKVNLTPEFLQIYNRQGPIPHLDDPIEMESIKRFERRYINFLFSDHPKNIGLNLSSMRDVYAEIIDPHAVRWNLIIKYSNRIASPTRIVNPGDIVDLKLDKVDFENKIIYILYGS